MPHSRTPLVTLVAAGLLIAAGLIGRQLSDRFAAQSIPPLSCEGTYMCNRIERASACHQVAPPCLPGYALQCDGTACGGGCGGTCCRCVPAGPPVQSSAAAQTSSVSVQLSSAPAIVSPPSSSSVSIAPIACTDTDGGDNPAVRGTATALNIAHEDQCVVYQDLGGGYGWHSVAECFPRPDPQPGIAYCTAVEYRCSGSNFNPVGYRNVGCALGCRNGLCLTAQNVSQASSSAHSATPAPACVDTDGGWDIYRRGSYGTAGGATNQEYCVLTECASANGPCTQKQVQSCGRGNFCGVYEFACAPDGTVNGARGGRESCVHGCVAGSCIGFPVPNTNGGTTGTTGQVQGGTTGVTGGTGVGTTGTTGANQCQSPQQCGTTQCGSCANVGSECKRICKVPTCAGGTCGSTYEWEACDPSRCR